MAAQGVSVLLQIVSIVVLARLLLPEDFGLIAMILAITAFVGLFKDMGLSTASVQRVSLPAEQVNALFWVNVAVGALLTTLVLAGSPLIAWFYGRPELVPVAALLSLTFLISSVGAQHAATLQRELRFLPRALAEVLGALSNLLIALVLALHDFGYWSLAWGTLGGTTVTTIIYFTTSGFRPGKPRGAAGLRSLIGFGANITAFELVNYFHRNLDNILIGRVWGAGALGLYSRAYQLMMMPINSLRTPINAVAFPALSRLQGDPPRFRHYYKRVASVLAFASIPLMGFLSANAEAVVGVALGPSWKELSPIFALLGLTGLIQPVASLRGLVLLSLGRSQRYLAWGVINAIAVSVAFLIGVQWGPIGVAAAYAISNYLILYPSLVFAFKETPLHPLDFFTTIAKPLAATAVAALASMFVSTGLLEHGPTSSLIAGALAFTVVFGVCFLLLPGGLREVRDYAGLASSILKSKRGSK